MLFEPEPVVTATRTGTGFAEQPGTDGLAAFEPGTAASAAATFEVAVAEFAPVGLAAERRTVLLVVVGPQRIELAEPQRTVLSAERPVVERHAEQLAAVEPLVAGRQLVGTGLAGCQSQRRRLFALQLLKSVEPQQLVEPSGLDTAEPPMPAAVAASSPVAIAEPRPVVPRFLSPCFLASPQRCPGQLFPDSGPSLSGRQR